MADMWCIDKVANMSVCLPTKLTSANTAAVAPPCVKHSNTTKELTDATIAAQIAMENNTKK